MEKTELVDDMGHPFLTEQTYMVQADDMDGKYSCQPYINLFTFDLIFY